MRRRARFRSPSRRVWKVVRRRCGRPGSEYKGEEAKAKDGVSLFHSVEYVDAAYIFERWVCFGFFLQTNIGFLKINSPETQKSPQKLGVIF